MNDEDIEGFEELFENEESEKTFNISNKIKPWYEPIHLPLSIIEILETWSKINSSSCRVGICPGDSNSLDGMFIHSWGEFHVEQPSRLTSIIEHLHNSLWLKYKCYWKLICGKEITNEQIKLVHSQKFLEDFLLIEHGEIVDDNLLSMRTLLNANGKYNFQSISPIITRACRIAAGSTINLIESVIKNEIDFGFALIRPAGHHSSTDSIGTFCGLNSISIGAVYAIEILKLNRVLILDWDVHRSGGTEQISNENKHKYRLIDIYAAFGKSSYSNNINCSNCKLIDLYKKNQIPGDKEYIEIFDNDIIPDIIQYSPSLILISAGYDSAKGESEECAQLTPNGYFNMTKKLKQLNIPLVFILEGGYQQQSLIQSIEATFKALLDL
ncbi:unnamed protein product [Adineta steineri]|uniref:histone deacetylase n=1 Tax=Adineta steineri TaxID=433720 RepID=A0A819BYR1_9BILA|nr:unnamed protein product [Adineta steineri]CAF3810247.1 unnamed protein product [Adineta steineri]